MLALATILVLAGLVSGGIRSQRDVARPKLFMTTAVVVLVLVSITAFVLGWMPLAHWIGHLDATGRATEWDHPGLPSPAPTFGHRGR